VIFLWHSGGGLGGIALASMLAEAGEVADAPTPRPEFNGGLHHPAKVKRVVQLFLTAASASRTRSTSNPSWRSGTASRSSRTPARSPRA